MRNLSRVACSTRNPRRDLERFQAPPWSAPSLSMNGKQAYSPNSNSARPAATTTTCRSSTVNEIGAKLGVPAKRTAPDFASGVGIQREKDPSRRPKR